MKRRRPPQPKIRGMTILLTLLLGVAILGAFGGAYYGGWQADFPGGSVGYGAAFLVVILIFAGCLIFDIFR